MNNPDSYFRRLRAAQKDASVWRNLAIALCVAFWIMFGLMWQQREIAERVELELAHHMIEHIIEDGTLWNSPAPDLYDYNPVLYHPTRWNAPINCFNATPPH